MTHDQNFLIHFSSKIKIFKKFFFKGSSSSDTWYAVLDFGTNYCNLNNLITGIYLYDRFLISFIKKLHLIYSGAALDKIKGYSETTSDSICKIIFN